MGKGDQRTRRGKINRGTFGKTRPKKKNKPGAKKALAKPRTAPPKKK
jgi:30S ribosomal protein S31